MTDSRAETAVQTVTPKSGRTNREVSIPKADPPPRFEEFELDAEDDGIELIVDEAPAEAALTTPAAPPNVLDELLAELRAPLERALGVAKRVRGSDAQAEQWFESQAKRRLLRLAERFTDELEATAVKKASQPPPPRRDSSIRDLIKDPHG